MVIGIILYKPKSRIDIHMEWRFIEFELYRNKTILLSDDLDYGMCYHGQILDFH